MSEITKPIFWVNLVFVVATTYILIMYLLTPSGHQCQMTFMMEPPRFIPITDGRKESIQPHGLNYKLFMYSELGFPQKSDLKDSMPILFVPGNAGSYQQVRSLASTCIRRQIQMIEAAKFVFFTIDFDGQLSGLRGQLIEAQTLFVQKSLVKITEMVPAASRGVIIIGHSVGGFISKALFTLPGFDSKTVPLLVSLASPLTRPHITFDKNTRDLYIKTNNLWRRRKNIPTSNETTLTLSISGGRHDKLVPPHLSMDPFFDMSLTTSAMRDVWLSTDHLSITWCRELMNKLAHLLSSLMDKRDTHMITDRNLAKFIMKNELLTTSQDAKIESYTSDGSWKSNKPHKVLTMMDGEFFSTDRTKIGNNIQIIQLSNETKPRNLLLSIDHIEPLKSDSIIGCNSVDFVTNNEMIGCDKFIPLVRFAKQVPSKRYEPNRSIIILREQLERIDHLVIDFTRSTGQDHSNKPEIKPPELIIIQSKNQFETQSLYLPSLIEFLTHKLTLGPGYVIDIKSDPSMALSYSKFRLENLQTYNQVFTIRYMSKKCATQTIASGALLMHLKGPYLIESFHPHNPQGENKLLVEAKISLSNMDKYFDPASNHDNSQYLEVLIDGTCNGSISIELNLMDLIRDVINKSLTKIITCATLIAYINLTTKLSALRGYNIFPRLFGIETFPTVILHFLSPFVLYYTSSIVSSSSIDNDTGNQEHISNFLIVCSLAHGLVAFLDHVTRRVIDLAIILDRWQTWVQTKMGKLQKIPNRSINGLNGPSDKESLDEKRSISLMKSHTYPVLLSIILTLSFIYSTAIISLSILFLTIKTSLSITNESKITTTEASNIPYCPSRVQQTLSLLSALGVLCNLSLIPNIPSTLVRLSKDKFPYPAIELDGFESETSFFITTGLALALVVHLCWNINDSIKLPDKLNRGSDMFLTRSFTQLSRSILATLVFLVAFLPIILIDSNLCQINHVLFASAVILII